MSALVLAACGTDETTAANRPNPVPGSTSTDGEPAVVKGTDINPMLTNLNLAELNTHFDTGDLDWDAADEQTITLADGGSESESDAVAVDGSTVTINRGGVYRVSGSLSDGQLVVDEPDDETVRVILDGVQITNSGGSAISLRNANEVTLVLQDGTSNTVEDGEDYTVADDATPVGAIASDIDLTIAGSGSLDVTGNANDAITSRDGIVIADGTITANAADDGIRGQHYLSILDGTIEVTSGGDSLKSDEFTDQDRGWVRIAAGDITLNSEDDGIDAEQAIQVAGGTVDIARSLEGIEAATIMLDGGRVSVEASDDAINGTAATPPGSSEEESGPGDTRQDDGSLVRITGGTVTASGGDDGIDANGSISITGGRITLNSPGGGGGTGPLDANGPVSIENVTVTANGEQVGPGDL